MDAASPHSNTLRKGRRSVPGQIYLVTFRTHQHQSLFTDWQTGSCVVHQLKQTVGRDLADTVCYVVMPDHVHWLVQLKSGLLSDLIRLVKSRAAIAYNKFCLRNGAVWQDGFQDHALRSDEQLVPVARYIVANPLRKGIVDDIGQYPLWDAVWLERENRGQARSHSPLEI